MDFWVDKIYVILQLTIYLLEKARLSHSIQSQSYYEV
jgi:hypothetical protein